jgi:hypothetical protein
MQLNLADTIHQATDNRFILSRLVDSIRTVGQESPLKGIGMVTGFTITKITAFALIYFCVEGSVRTLTEENHDTSLVRLRPLGDAGGWLSLGLFSMIAMKDVFQRLIAEGEYKKLMLICMDWIQNQQEVADPLFHKTIYGCKTLVPKRLISNRMAVIDLIKNIPNQKCRRVARLQTRFQSIKKEIETKTSALKTFQRIALGKTVVLERGCRSLSVSLTFGVAIPILLFTFALYSFIGEIGLGHELFIDRKELTDTGHFGEWPINLIEALGAALYFSMCYLTVEADLEIVKAIYAKHLRCLKNRPKQYAVLRKIANQELLQLANRCNYNYLPMQYKFKKL